VRLLNNARFGGMLPAEALPGEASHSLNQRIIFCSFISRQPSANSSGSAKDEAGRMFQYRLAPVRPTPSEAAETTRLRNVLKWNTMHASTETPDTKFAAFCIKLA
jgi:hypothetical protein